MQAGKNNTFRPVFLANVFKEDCGRNNGSRSEADAACLRD
jgi:hypothetical protein